jgi:hypothetical protein
MRALLYHWLDWLTDRLIEMMEKLEPIPPRKQELDYTISALPDEILAIVRVTYYKDGKADEVDQVTLYEDGQNGYDSFAALVSQALNRGANVSIRSGYRPEDLGIGA